MATRTLDPLRNNRFHNTALCSLTRPALLTGHNYHRVGTKVIIEMGTGYPGYTGIVPNTTAGFPEILRQNGYTTSAFGKWHNAPVAQPKTTENGSHVIEDLVDDAIGSMNQGNGTNPNTPWFMYFFTGAMHGPHDTPKTFREKYKARFDSGWDQYRKKTFARQKELNVIQEHIRLTPRIKELMTSRKMPSAWIIA